MQKSVFEKIKKKSEIQLKKKYDNSFSRITIYIVIIGLIGILLLDNGTRDLGIFCWIYLILIFSISTILIEKEEIIYKTISEKSVPHKIKNMGMQITRQFAFLPIPFLVWILVTIYFEIPLSVLDSAVILFLSVIILINGLVNVGGKKYPTIPPQN